MPWLDQQTAPPPLQVVGWRPDPPDDSQPITNTIMLGITRVLPAGDWDYYLEEDLTLRAVLTGQGPWHRSGASTPLEAEDLGRRYALNFPGRELDQDLSQVGVKLPRLIKVWNWLPKSTFANLAGDLLIAPQVFHGVSAANVRDRSLPENMEAAGLRLDPNFIRKNNINAVVRAVDDEGHAVFLKTEENRSAIQAEILCSAIWLRLGWPGLAGRASLTDDGSVLIVPEVGTSTIRSLGSFQDYFVLRVGAENSSTLKAPRAPAILRIGLRDLKLSDEDDVLRFVTTNAVWGNSDRHRDNVCYGWQAEIGSPAGGSGYLLPIDHGRCFFNNRGQPGDTIAGRPADAVTGRIGNPHQLLRAFVERVAVDEAEAARVIATWLDRMSDVLFEFDRDPEWKAFEPEISEALERVTNVRDDVDGFIDECRKVVIP